MAPVGCTVGPPITGQLTLEGIPVLGLVDTGASVSCLGFSIWWRYRAQWGALKQFEGTVHGAHGKPLQIAGRTQHLDIQWGEGRGRASFIVIVVLESPPCLIGMDIMQSLRVHIDVTNGTATPAQPDPQTVHLNAAQRKQQRKEMSLPRAGLRSPETADPPQTQSQRKEKPLLEAGSPAVRTASPPQISQQRKEIPLPKAHPSPMGAADSSQIQPQKREMPLPGAGISALPIAETPFPDTALPGELPPIAPLSTSSPCTATPHTASRARLLQTADIPPETARLVRCHNPWPAEDVLFCPDDALPAFVTGIPALSSGLELWIAVHNHRSEPLQLHSKQNIGILEVVTLADTPPTTSQASSRPDPPRRPPLPERLSLLQQQQLNELSSEFNDVFSQGEDNLGSTPLLEHAIDPWAPAPPPLSTAEPRSSMGGDVAGPTNVDQQRHPPLEQPVGFSSSNGAKKRW